MPVLVRLDRVTKDYSEGRELRHVLKDASLSVEEGEFVAIRGRSGSGKSTLLNLVAGIDQRRPARSSSARRRSGGSLRASARCCAATRWGSCSSSST